MLCCRGWVSKKSGAGFTVLKELPVPNLQSQFGHGEAGSGGPGTSAQGAKEASGGG